MKIILLVANACMLMCIGLAMSLSTQPLNAQTTQRAMQDSKALSFSDSLDLKIGQMIMIGINSRKSLSSSDNLRNELRKGYAGGIVLFEKNVASSNAKNTLKKLIADMQAESRTPLFIAIDEEGGRVHRLKAKYGFFDMPSAEYLGNLNSEETTLFHNRKLAMLLKELGINLNFAPTVDVAVNPNNPVIVRNERSYSKDPDIVAKQAQWVIQAHHESGVKTILKHFPGHGSSTKDSHHGIVDVTNTWSMQELMPYKDIISSGNCDAVMTAHIINKHWDDSRLPATLSDKVVGDMLRGLLGFKGVVFSDDMQMHAISKNYGFENAIKLAINAGVDVVMFGNAVNDNDAVTATEIHGIIRKLVDNKEITPGRIDTSYRRIMALKARQ